MTFLAILMSSTMLLVGLLAFGWAPGTVAFFFWFEAAVIGALTLLKIGMSLPADVPGTGKSVRYQRLPREGERTRVSSSVPRVNPLLALPLFMLFYGALLAGYGGLLLLSLKEPDYPALVRSAMESRGAWLAMAFIVGEHLWRFRRDFVNGPAWLRKDPTFHFWKPFGLAIIAWLAFFFGFLMLAWLNSPLPVLTVLIVLKAIAESFNAIVDAQAGEWQRVDDAP